MTVLGGPLERKRPDLLMQRAPALECELAAAQRRMNGLEGKVPWLGAAPPAAGFLNLGTSDWGETENCNAPIATSNKRYDIFKTCISAMKWIWRAGRFHSWIEIPAKFGYLSWPSLWWSYSSRGRYSERLTAHHESQKKSWLNLVK